jgi:hypothetical protein
VFSPFAAQCVGEPGKNHLTRGAWGDRGDHISRFTRAYTPQ